MRRLFAGLLLTTVTACGPNAAGGKTREQVLHELNVLAARCSPGGKIQFELTGTTQLRLLPSSSVSFEEVDCFLAGIKPYQFDLGFVGNEAYERR